MQRLFDHLDLRVKNLREAEPFYSLVLPTMGFPKRTNYPEAISFESLDTVPDPPGIYVTEDPDHRPNATRFAFSAASKEAVDQFSEVLRSTQARNIEGPDYCPEYSPTYYAVFFEDSSGNRFEVCCRHAVPMKQ